MLRAFSTAATGMVAQQLIVDTIANNLANINTSGFKRSQVDFQDLMYLKMQEAGRSTANGVIAPAGFEIGSGVRPASTMRSFTEGELDNTGNWSDVAIQGDGFFQVAVPGGQIRYSRDGSLHMNATGELCNSSGYLIQPAITVPTDARNVSIGADGTVTAFVGANATATSLGQIQIVKFANPAGLSGEGGNLFAETPASGAPQTGIAGQNGFGSIQQNFLERSNVQMVTELVGLISAQRAYEINSRAIRAGDDMLSTTNQLIR